MTRPSSRILDRHEGLLRVLAVVGALALPVLWLGSLRGDQVFLWTNLLRVVGGLLAAGGLWLHHQREGRPGTPSWQTLLVAGVVGSIAVSALSLLVPGLGRITASGWIMSGVAGGGMLALTAYAIRGNTGQA